MKMGDYVDSQGQGRTFSANELERTAARLEEEKKRMKKKRMEKRDEVDKEGLENPPIWYDKDKLTKAMFAPDYSGWVIDLGDGTCRLANSPMLGEDGPKWGDRVRLMDQGEYNLPIIDPKNVIERYEPI